MDRRKKQRAQNSRPYKPGKERRLAEATRIFRFYKNNES